MSTKWFVKVPGLVGVTAADRIVLNAIQMAPGVNIRPVAGGPLKLHSYDADALLQGPAPDRAAGCEVLRSRAVSLLPRTQPITLLRSHTGLRPIPLDGLPIVGALAGVEGVCAVVTHRTSAGSSWLTTAGFSTFVVFLSRGDERGFESRRSRRGRTSTASE